jgi:hypothetical protein
MMDRPQAGRFKAATSEVFLLFRVFRGSWIVQPEPIRRQRTVGVVRG